MVGCGEIDGLNNDGRVFSESFHCKQLRTQQDCFFKVYRENGFLGDGFKYFLFSTLMGEDDPILTSIFFKRVETTN